MINKEVVPAFDMLLEELERIIPDLNDQAKALMDQKKYDQAHALLNKAQSVVAFQGKVGALREEWVRMQVPPTKLPEPILPPSSPKPVTRIKQGERTHEDAFYMTILMALDELGGRAHCQKVIKKLEKFVGDQFTEKDWEIMPSGRNEIRWINTARWTRQRLVNDGLLASNSPRGIWEITPAGREALEVL